MTASNRLNITMVGAGGHAESAFGILSSNQLTAVQNVVGTPTGKDNIFSSLNNFETDEELFKNSEPHRFINGIGAHPKTNLRKSIFELYRTHGFQCETIISDSAHVHDQVSIGEGAQIFAGSMINIGAKIEDNAIINTGAIIEHGAIIEAHCHIAPGAIILGNAIIRSGSFVGAGAVVLPEVEVGRDSIIGALVKLSSSVPEMTLCRGHHEN